MQWFHAALFGIVEGITEFLPISSTGHLILTARFIGFEQTEFLKSFEIAIQFGAILSVVALYWRTLFLRKEVLARVVVAFVPTAVIGFVLYKIVKAVFLGNDAIVLTALFLGGILLIIFERFHHESEDAVTDPGALTYRQAFAIGVFQSFAVVPGVSRSAATILGGLLLGVKRIAIVEFSFLLAVPTMLAATSLDLFRTARIFTNDEVILLLTGFVTSFLVALLAIKFLLRYIARHDFTAFGVYRIILAVLFWFFVL